MIKNCIVILNYNDSDTTINFINQIKNYKTLDLIVIVDNNSKDNSFAKLSKYVSDKIRVIKNEKNGGYNSGNNVGCKYILDKYKEANIFISNPDIIVSEETMKEMVDVINNNKNIAVVSPYIVQDNTVERGWKIPSPLTEALFNLPFVYKLSKRRVKKKNIRFYNEKHYKGKTSYVDAVTGCFFLIDSAIISKINYFDEGVFLYAEEDILGVQIKKSNKKIVVVNDLVAVHNHGTTINKNMNEINKIKISNKSKIYFQKKYNNANFIEVVILYLSVGIKLINTYIKNIFRR